MSPVNFHSPVEITGNRPANICTKVCTVEFTGQCAGPTSSRWMLDVRMPVGSTGGITGKTIICRIIPVVSTGGTHREIEPKL